MHPIAFNLGPLTIHSYGVMMALAFIAGLWTASRRGVHDGIAPDKIFDIGPWIVGGTILGARVLYVTTYWHDSFAGRPWWSMFAIWEGGLVFYGGLIGASLAAILYARVKKISIWKLADVLAPSIALGYVFGRIGCFLNGCCYGRACSLPWAVTYPVGNLNGAPTFPVHPTQIYDSLLSLLLYLGLAWLYRRKKFDGQVFAAYLLCYAVTRSIVESFRGDYPPDHIHVLHLTPGQLVSIGIFATGVAMWAVLRRFQLKRAV
ncbi:MAG TPA: prolipoprotein diacylglyceryl transferase [Candidatus Angelobacter sp.]|nr:prolipoprotein diacylglyceryl transferase [Candidatus Angelobacter sp.]